MCGYDELRSLRSSYKKVGNSTQVTERTANIGKTDKQNAKLGYREQRELAALPVLIDKLELEQKQLEVHISASDFYKQDKDKITASLARLKEIQAELACAYERWEKLDTH